MVQLIKDFLSYIRIKRELAIAELTPEIEARLSLGDASFEEEVNKVMLNGLAKQMIKENVSHEFAEGYKSALNLRLSLIRAKRK